MRAQTETDQDGLMFVCSRSHKDDFNPVGLTGSVWTRSGRRQAAAAC